MKNKLILLTLIMMLVFTSCGKTPINIKNENKLVEVSETDYRGSYITFSRVGNSNISINHPASYSTTVICDGIKYTSRSRDVYEVCKDLKGKNVNAIIQTFYYDDNTASIDIDSIIVDDIEYNW